MRPTAACRRKKRPDLPDDRACLRRSRWLPEEAARSAGDSPMPNDHCLPLDGGTKGSCLAGNGVRPWAWATVDGSGSWQREARGWWHGTSDLPNRGCVWLASSSAKSCRGGDRRGRVGRTGSAGGLVAERRSGLSAGNRRLDHWDTDRGSRGLQALGMAARAPFTQRIGGETRQERPRSHRAFLRICFPAVSRGAGNRPPEPWRGHSRDQLLTNALRTRSRALGTCV